MDSPIWFDTTSLGWSIVYIQDSQVIIFKYYCSSLDKQRICVNTQLKSSKKQLKLNVCVPKSNSVDRYAITCDVIAYHSVHFISICVIYKCQSGIDFFLLASAQYNSNFMNKYRHQSSILAENETLQNGCEQLMSTRR